MREFKFRVYNNKTKSWVHGPGQEVNLFGEMILLGGFMKEISIEDFDNCEVLQNTGLLDKLGKEIYEGDIVDTRYVNGSNSICMVESGYLSRIKIINLSFPKFDSFYTIPIESFKIIGNKFDDPDLLK